eukprot:m.70108 g.70108  ORF g.70108 m.70108 type:complete len:151 (+) comp14039_c0_seq4:1524-1976(+)
MAEGEGAAADEACDQPERPDVELLRSYLEPMLFHPSCRGTNATLSSEGLVASRINSFSNAVVFSEEPLPLIDDGYFFEVEVLERQRGWAGGLELGIVCAVQLQVLASGEPQLKSEISSLRDKDNCFVRRGRGKAAPVHDTSALQFGGRRS